MLHKANYSYKITRLNFVFNTRKLKITESQDYPSLLTPNCKLRELDKFSSIQFSRSVVSDSLRPHGLQHARLPCPLLKLMSMELVMSSNHLILCCPLLLLPSIFPSIRVFSNESVLPIRWPKYCLGQLLEPWCPLLDKDWKTSSSPHC